jgi:hypothetical protein
VSGSVAHHAARPPCREARATTTCSGLSCRPLITDGQIYLSPSLFELGALPAVDVAKSVSRVGGKARRAAYRAVAEVSPTQHQTGIARMRCTIVATERMRRAR